MRYTALIFSGFLVGCLGTLNDKEETQLDPGRVTVHRLNNAEYANTIRDLLGTTTPVWQDFPNDDRGYGFDNIADVLSLSPLHLELYQRAAETVVAEALAAGGSGEQALRIEAETATHSNGNLAGTTWVLTSTGTISSGFDASAAGEYRVSVRAWGQQAGPAVVRMSIGVSGETAVELDVPATSTAPGTYETTFELAAGAATVSVGFVNDYYVAATGEDRNLVVDWIEVTGPLGALGEESPLRARLVLCDPAEAGATPCLRTILEAFAKRAFRRPVTSAEVDRLLAVGQAALDDGQDFDRALALALEAVLVSPHFLYRIEVDPDPRSTTPHHLTPWELASRLSYFLWSSMPDDALFAAAEAGELGTSDELRAQVSRMLADPKAAALVDNFAGQWLFTRALVDHTPDYATFPDYDQELADSMREETLRFFREILAEDLPIDQLLLADFTFVDARLAEHYGLPPVPAGEWRRVSLAEADTPRRGILGHGSVLTVTSFPTRTSPVKRGKWVLEQLLCSAPPAPPPGVEGLPDEDMPSGSLREQLEQHRSDPTCAACHATMDPIGFSLESFDAIGRFRTTDTGGFPIDDSGELADGTAFRGQVELAQLLAADPRFARCVAEKIYTYGLGRGPEDEAQAHIDHLTESFVDSGLQLRELIASMVIHEAFRMRRGER